MTTIMVSALGAVISILSLEDGGTKSISKKLYTTKDGMSHTAKRTRGDYIV
jgi:hypothetical protein